MENKTEINEFKEKINKTFTSKDLGFVNQILSMQIRMEEDGLYKLYETAYASEIRDTFKMTQAKCEATPLEPSIKYKKVDYEQWKGIKREEITYRQTIGSFLCLTCGSRPDIVFSYIYTSQFNEKHTEGK